MSRTARAAAVIVALQAALIGIYWLVERERSAADDPSAGLSTAPPVEVSGPVPSLALTSLDGSRFALGPRDRTMLVHIWATWCPPCRDELPGLMALPKTHPVEVLAIALDDDRAAVETFLDGEHAPNVVLGDAEQVEKALGVRSLPVTFLVEPGARLRFRFEGARDWTDPQFAERWLESGGDD